MNDNESGLYYLQSRYYDPKICRFINADAFASTGQGFIGYNMFAYCNNNPVRYTDSTGIMATEAAIVATNFWNPAGWTAAAILLVEVLVVLVVTDFAFDAASHYNSSTNSVDAWNNTYAAKNNHSKSNRKSSSTYGAQATSPKPPKKPNQNKEYRGGTLYNKNGVRVDYEYNGNGTGNVHIQTKTGKYYYDSANNVLRTGVSNTSPLAPSYIQAYLEDVQILYALVKAVRFIESMGGFK